MTKQFAVGPDVEPYVQHARPRVDAGPDRLGLVNVFTKEPADRLRTLTLTG